MTCSHMSKEYWGELMSLLYRLTRHSRLLPAAAVLFAVIFAVPASADMPTLRILGNGAPDEIPGITLLSSSRQGVEMEFELPTLAVAEDMIDGKVFHTLSIPGGGDAGEIGQPGLPVFGRLVAIPDRADVRISYTVLEEEEYDGYRILPVQPRDAASLVLDSAAYAVNSFGNAHPVITGDPALMRGFRVASLTFQPVSYNPAMEKIRVARRIRVELSFEGENLTNQRTGESRPIPRSFDRIYREAVINYDDFAGDRAVEDGTYLIICPNSSAVTSRLEPLVEWRRRSGTRVYLATTAETGTTTSSIKNYIQNAYDNWEYPPEYIAIVGDHNGSYAIPTWFHSGGGEGDHPYGQLEGDDILLDVHIGRLSIQNTTHLDVIIDKIMGYERNPYTQDPSWFTAATLAGDPSISGFSCVQLMQWVKTRLLQLNYTRVDTIYSGSFTSQMTASLNQGSTVFCYRGWLGMSGWSNSNTYQLTNGYRLPFGTISTCGTGNFASENETRSEGFLRAGSVGNPKGTIGCIGTATSSTNTRYNNAMTKGTWHAVIYADIREMGAALTMGKLGLYINYPGQTYAVSRNSYWNNLMGDPAVPVWTAYPATMTVSHPSQIAVGTNAVNVTVSQGFMPVAGAKVCLMKGTETWSVGYTDASGFCQLPVSALTTGTMQVTVTKYDHKPYLADMPVTIPLQYVGFQDYELDDSQGNGNGRLNPGETVGLPILLRNFGSQTANSVSAELTTDDPYVTLISDNQTYGNIAGGQTAWSSGDYVFSLDPACPNGHVIRFGLDIVSGMSNWQSIVEITVSSAEFVAGTVTLYGDGGNGRIDPGQTVDLAVRLNNTGDENASGITAVLTSASPWITVVDPSGSYPNIPMGGNETNSVNRFTVEASDETFAGHEAPFEIITTFNGGVIDTTRFSLVIGLRTATDPTGPDAYGYYAFDNTDTSYLESPTYDWIEVDPNYGGTGAEIVLGDYGEHQDKSRTINLPFTFQYYGETFDRVTVCSNGWLAFGDTYLTDYRNWTIPSAGSPQNLVAVFWDDLYQSGGAGVFQRYDAANNRWICQWSRMRNRFGNHLETFQVILHDPAHYPTVSGDGIIDMQYHTVNNVDTTDGYATVGIQNRDQTVGLLYTYFNLYTPGSATLAAGRAIRFMPIAAQPTGVLEGMVINASHMNAPIPGAEVSILGGGRVFYTSADGSYGGSAPIGTFDITASAAGFEPDTAHAVTINESSTTQLNFSLTDIAGPEITDVTVLERTTDNTGPYVVDASIYDASGIASAEVIYRVNGGGWIPVPMTLSLDGWSGEIPGLPSGMTIDYYVQARDNAGWESVYPHGAPADFLTFLITEMFYFYDVEDPEDTDWITGVPGDDATAGLWERADPIGTEWNGDPVQPDHDHTPDPGVICFITGQHTAGQGPGYNDVDDGCTTLMSPTFDLSGQERAFVTYWRWWAITGNSADDTFIIDVSGNGGLDWVPLERVDSHENFWRERSFDLTEFIELTDQVVFRWVACDLGSPGLVEAAIDDFGIEVFRAASASVGDPDTPSAFVLFQNRPNPFSRDTAIRFSLEQASSARLTVYDVQGRRVRSLVDGSLPAGAHTVVWNGRDDHGGEVPSGVYFYRLDAGGRSGMRKLLHLE